MINMAQGGNGYGNHTCTVVGYSGYRDDMHIILHITWDDGQHYFSCGNWWESSFVKVTHK